MGDNIHLPPGEPIFPYELGLTLAAMGNRRGGIAALQRAVEIAPALTAAWRALADLLALEGDEAGATAARDEADALPFTPARTGTPDPLALIKASAHLLADSIRQLPPQAAINLLRAHLREAPTDAAGLRLLAHIARREQRLGQAGRLLERALMLAPHYDAARADYAAVLASLDQHAEAVVQLEHLVANAPDRPEYRLFLAMSLAGMAEYEQSLAMYESVMPQVLERPKFLLNYADVLKYAGRRDDSVRAYRTCVNGARLQGEAWWGLANVKNEHFSAADQQAMRALLNRADTSDRDRYHVHYALGNALEQAGAYEPSFEQYAKGAALKRAELDYAAEEVAAGLDEAKALFTPARFAAWAGQGCADPAPIFVLGMPRAGSTLVEHILASHSMVEGTQELQDIGMLVRELHQGQSDSPAVYELLTLDRAGIAALGERYIERTRLHRRTDKPFFIDKMPDNWAHIGLLHVILPHAKIIDVRRHPMANGFSLFKQLFAGGAAFSYDLTELGQHQRAYADWMAHIDSVLPGRVHRVMYEDLVTNTEAEIRRMLDYCGLPFEAACLRFWETERIVATPSAEQVRRPMSKDALDQWRKFEPWLSPLKDALGTIL
jgi:tetratricopeptide (TPR) repeat protein